MGFMFYTLSDAREAGYGVEAECDGTDCSKTIDRGLGYLCGQNPDGWRSEDETGCGRYFCGDHMYAHDCPNQECGKHAAGGNLYCGLLTGHAGSHQDPNEGTVFTQTEEDLELFRENIEVLALGEDGEYWLVTGTRDAHSAEVAVRAYELAESNREPGWLESEDQLTLEYRDDLCWRWGGLRPSHTDDDELMTTARHFELYAVKAERVFPFAGYRVTL